MESLGPTGEARNLLDSDLPRQGISALTQYDQQWGQGYVGDTASKAPHSYFDYYFSGQDIQVYVDGTEDVPEFRDIPIMQFGWNVTQQKSPLYGFWSYEYDAVMRGTRIVSGVFTIATRGPDYMRSLLSKAAQARSTRQAPYQYYRGLTEDDANIEQYWGKSMDPAVLAAGNNIFVAHPPFSFVIVYGVQSVSIGKVASGAESMYDRDGFDTPLLADTNERLLESDPIDQATRFVLEACEIQSVQIAFGPDGNPVGETYQFFARDMIIPSRWNGSRSFPVPSNYGDPTDNANRTGIGGGGSVPGQVSKN